MATISPVFVPITIACAAAGAELGDAPQQRLLGGVLHRAVDRQHDVVARHGLPATTWLAAGDRAAAGRHLERQLARLAGEHVVVLLLEAGRADAVDVGAADDAARVSPPGRIRRSSR